VQQLLQILELLGIYVFVVDKAITSLWACGVGVFL
jgi:hypothetical protein